MLGTRPAVQTPKPGRGPPGNRWWAGDAPIGIVAVLALLLASAGVAAQSGQSLGVTPPDHGIENAQQGESYRRQVTVQNEFDSNTTITVDTSGEVGAWTTTDPAAGFDVPPRTHEAIDITIEIPADAVNGTYLGKVHITAEPKAQPNGSGAAIRYSVAVLLSVQVGGEPVRDLSFTGGGSSDVEEGTPPDVKTTVFNGGNVRDTATACARILALHSDEVIAQVRESKEVLPGEQTTISFSFDEALPPSQYRVRILPDCDRDGPSVTLDEDGTFKVVPPGTLGKDGILRFIEHAPRVAVGRPVEIVGVFENKGDAAIARAAFTCRLYLDGELVHVVESEPRYVPVGEGIELTGFFIPEEPGRYELRGTVTYDGFESLSRETFFVVQTSSADAGPGNLLWQFGPYLALAVLGIGLVVLLHRGRSRPEGEPSEGEDPTHDATDRDLPMADVEALDR